MNMIIQKWNKDQLKVLTKPTKHTKKYFEAVNYSRILETISLPSEDGLYLLNVRIDPFGDMKFSDLKKLCQRHRWKNGWVCSVCNVTKADFVEAKKNAERSIV